MARKHGAAAYRAKKKQAGRRKRYRRIVAKARRQGDERQGNPTDHDLAVTR